MVVGVEKHETRVHQPRNLQTPTGYLQQEVIPPLPKASVHPKRCQGRVHEWLMAHGFLGGADVEAFIARLIGRG